MKTISLPKRILQDPEVSYCIANVCGKFRINYKNYDIITNTNSKFTFFMIKLSKYTTVVRSKYFLTMHILTSIFVLGTSLIFMLIIIHSDPAHYYKQTILTSEVSFLDLWVLLKDIFVGNIHTNLSA